MAFTNFQSSLKAVPRPAETHNPDALDFQQARYGLITNSKRLDRIWRGLLRWATTVFSCKGLCVHAFPTQAQLWRVYSEITDKSHLGSIGIRVSIFNVNFQNAKCHKLRTYIAIDTPLTDTGLVTLQKIGKSSF